MAIQEQFVSDEVRASLAFLLDDEASNEMRTRPGFLGASRGLVECWRSPEAEGDEDKAFARNLRDLGRFISGIWALYLHSTPGGLTLSRLAGLLEAGRVTGTGRARAILIYLQFIGYITAGAATGDARLKPYVPTQRLIGAFHRRLIRELTAKAPMHSAIRGTLGQLHEPGAFDVYVELMGQIYVAYMGVRQRPGPSLEMFAQRYAGMMMLGELLACAAPDDVFPPQGPLRYSLSAIAQAAGVSRTQVRRVFREAEAVGFITLPKEGLALPTPLLAEHIELATAAQIVGGLWCCERFMARMGQAA